jgi:hypothetical protein
MIDTASPDEDVMVDVAIADLHDRFPSIEDARIEATVRRLVHEWRARARVTTFIGIIASREARAELAADESDAPDHHLAAAVDHDTDAWVSHDRDAAPVPDDADAWVVAASARPLGRG